MTSTQVWASGPTPDPFTRKPVNTLSSQENRSGAALNAKNVAAKDDSESRHQILLFPGLGSFPAFTIVEQ